MRELAAGTSWEAAADNFPTGLTGTIGVRVITLPEGTVVLARTTAGITEAPAGSGLYARAMAPIAEGGTYAVVWDDGADLFAREELEVRFAGAEPATGYGGYPTVEQLVAASTVSALTDSDPGEQARLRRSSILAVEDYCRQSFDHWTGSKIVDGPGGKRLYLPRRLSSLTTLTVHGSILNETNVELDEDHGVLTVIPMRGALNYYERASVDADMRTGMVLEFTSEPDSVAISGVWGWAPEEFPQAVADAILKDMEDTALADTNKLTPTIRQYRHMGVRDISQGNMRASITTAPGLSEDAVGLLQGFVWTPPLGALA